MTGHAVSPPARPDGRRATLADVARAANVSGSTASLALNRSGPVSAATRERVLAAARDLGYSGPDPLARSLRRGRCGVVAVVVGARLGYAFSDPMMAALLDGLAEEIGAVGSSLLLVPVERGPLGGTQGASRLASLPLDAAVLVDCTIRTSDLLPGLLARGAVVVGVDGPLDGPPDARVPLVTIDDEGATAALVDHLAALGHRTFGIVRLPTGADPVDGAGGAGVPRRRTAAARAAITRLTGGTMFLEPAEWNTVKEGERAAGRLLDGPERPTAIIAQSDVLALGCLRAAAGRGLAVPGELSVAGFDGVEMHLLSGTRLTTIEQPSALKGRTAARMVLARLAGERPDDVVLPTALRVGTTTGPVPPGPRGRQ